jgi:DNA adenine methylase
MYRLNREGRFNVPFGGGQRTPEPLWKDNLLLKASAALSDAKILSADFETTIQTAGEGDVVYCDPTYTVAHNNNGFIRYNERNFSWEDQQRLASAAALAAERGATVLVSNAAHQEIRELYSKAHVQQLERQTLLCPKPNKRGSTQEYLFVLGR